MLTALLWLFLLAAAALDGLLLFWLLVDELGLLLDTLPSPENPDGIG